LTFYILGDSFLVQNESMFSTTDKDNDAHSGNCAVMYHGAWWYGKCHSSNLNGKYLNGTHSLYAIGVTWKTWKGYYYSLKTTEIKFRGYF